MGAGKRLEGRLPVIADPFQCLSSGSDEGSGGGKEGQRVGDRKESGVVYEVGAR